jgi:peptidyl-prolyl cis-trans isomerase C
MITRIALIALASLSMLATAHANETKGNKPVDDNTPVISVNKTPITQATYIDALRAHLASGVKDSQPLRQMVLDDLVISEALAQEAKKAKLNADTDVKRAIDNAQRKILAEAYIMKQLAAKPITEADARAEYDRQIALTKDGRNSVEYKAAQIVVKDEATAQAVLKRLKSGEDFAKVAKESSIDQAARQHGGALPWSLPDQFIKPLGDVIINLDKGQIVNAPTQTAIGWHILKLEESRPFVAPSFEDSKGRMMQTLLERKKQDIVQEIMKKAEVK